MTVPVLLDRRLHAFRSDLADARLKGQVEAERFVQGKPMRVALPVVDLRGEPRPASGPQTQFLLGDDVIVFDEADGWCWVQATRDGYVGYVEQSALEQPKGEPTHVVNVPRTFVYPGADLRFPHVQTLSLGARVIVTGKTETRGTNYLVLENGEAIIARHLRPVAGHADDFVAVAETLLHTPYLWGGTSAFGIDCSGLVQLSMRMAGKNAPRDSDMQAAAIGAIIEPDADYGNLKRGDLVFWKGHAAIMADEKTLIHANGHTMSTNYEPLHDAIERIAYLYGYPTAVRRP
ncbi:NlpC/P60 family protein [Phyllobacterium leguminum]|uniref:NlpC/P60 family protein n=1 Tax=Phyllobacterium leguminum TaxID=314237 RepID=A0A318T521_9HYPH|nr:NlpC/P60 family protein [Phyllobacterium leguminum]PYE89254.1 NlpC/P60 family protein [Phyllobacterium leguminum]